MLEMKKLLALIPILLLLVALSSCGSYSQTTILSQKPPSLADVDSYHDDYDLFHRICLDAWNVGLAGINVHNQGLDRDDPEFFSLVYVPFYTQSSAISENLSETTFQQARSIIRNAYGSTDIQVVDANAAYAIDYTITEGKGEDTVEIPANTSWTYDRRWQSLSVIAAKDGEVFEITQFVPQGKDVYLLYTQEDLALITWRDGEIFEMYHAHRGPDELYTLDDYDFYPDGTITENQILGDPKAEYIIVVEDGKMTYTGADGETWTERLPLDSK